MSQPPQFNAEAIAGGDVPRLTHEWMYPDAPGQRQCRYCLAYETNVSQLQDVGLCPARMQQQQRGKYPPPSPSVSAEEHVIRYGMELTMSDTAPFPEVGAAYVAGVVARRNWVPKGHHGDPNPYHHATQPWLAWRSGWNDQGVWMARGPAMEQDG